MKKSIKSLIFIILFITICTYIFKSLVYNGLSGYWYFNSIEKIDKKGERYLYINDSVKVIYLKKDSLECYKGEMIVLENNKVMADMFYEIIPNKWLILDHLRADYIDKLKIF